MDYSDMIAEEMTKKESKKFVPRIVAKIKDRSDVYGLKIEIIGELNNFDFLKVHHQNHGEVLCQITNIIRDKNNSLTGICNVLGYRAQGILQPIRQPFDNYCKVEVADEKFIEKTIALHRETGALIGTLEFHDDLRIKLKYKDLLTKHISIMAKSGVGKSYTVGVLLEEIIDMNIPILILDPHNEYSSMAEPNDNKKDIDRLEQLGLKAKGFKERMKVFSPDTEVNPEAEKIELDINKLSYYQLVESLPEKLSASQKSLLMNIGSNLNNKINFDELIFHLSNEESVQKWNLITLLERVKKEKLFSNGGTPLKNIVKHKQATIISLKGVRPFTKDVLVTNLLEQLFEARKKEEVPPFLLVLEEGHHFAPEKGMNSVKSKEIIRTIAGEGRKFGLGLCIVSQRPAKVDKNVISQCNTQIIMKVTNPNDLDACISSAEGLDKDSRNEIQQLNVGSCLLTGIIDTPLKVKVRPRISKHGGETKDIKLK